MNELRAPPAAVAGPPAPLPATPLPALELNRSDCAAIRGSDYLSLTERSWFIVNCMTEAARARVVAVEAVAAAPAEVAPAAAGGSVIDQFVSGYRAAGGPEAHLERIVSRVIPCESGGNPAAYSSVGPFYGLMQFLGATWSTMGGGDWRDPYTQGVNTARLLQRANPASQWPVCWYR